MIRILGNTVGAPDDERLDAEDVRRATHLDASRFGVALIGKDGSEVFRQSETVAARSLFAVIDAMPMRREEMRRRGS